VRSRFGYEQVPRRKPPPEAWRRTDPVGASSRRVVPRARARLVRWPRAPPAARSKEGRFTDCPLGTRQDVSVSRRPIVRVRLLAGSI
jgi:hypothetical protein